MTAEQLREAAMRKLLAEALPPNEEARLYLAVPQAPNISKEEIAERLGKLVSGGLAKWDLHRRGKRAA